MKSFKSFLIVLCYFVTNTAFSQNKIQLTLKWNYTLLRYEVYAKPNFSSSNFSWGPSQISVVTPASAPNTALQITSVAGGTWVDDSRVFAPSAMSNSDFHGIETSGESTSLTASQEKLLFTFVFSDGACRDGLRLFENLTDPKSSAAGMSGGDFKNSIADISQNDIYQSNYANTGTTCIDPLTLDSDNDGVLDIVDEFPFDPTKAYISYTPSKTTFSTLAYEDLWPASGDYDFNDLVLNYQFQEVLNANYQVVELNVRAVIRAIGASYKNGWGFQLPVAPSQIKSVSGTKLTAGFINLSSNGTEAGQSKAVIIAFDNAFDNIKRSSSSFVNTDMAAPKTVGDTLKLKVVLNAPTNSESLGLPPYNPFLIINGDRGKEVHLVNQAPTDKANPAYFNSLQDASKVATNNYYLDANNLPWALNFPSNFDYPQEKVSLLDTYLKFRQWAESGGGQYIDWYVNKSGYRNSGNIYSK